MSWSISLVSLEAHLTIGSMSVVEKKKEKRAFCDEWTAIGDGRLVAMDAW